MYTVATATATAAADLKTKTTKKTNPKIVLWHQGVTALCRELRVTTRDYSVWGCKTGVLTCMSNPVPAWDVRQLLYHLCQTLYRHANVSTLIMAWAWCAHAALCPRPHANVNLLISGY